MFCCNSETKVMIGKERRALLDMFYPGDVAIHRGNG